MGERMEITTLNKLKKLIRRFDRFECEPSDFLHVDSLLAEAKRKLAKAEQFPESKAVQDASFALRGRVVSLLYRLDRGSELPAKVDCEKLLAKMAKTILDYKGFNEDTFDLMPSLKVEELCTYYPAYAELIAENDALFLEFFKWAIRDNNQVAPFVLFPAMVEVFKECNLSQRIGYYQGEHLTVHIDHDYDGNPIKWLALRIEGKEIKIGDQKQKVRMRDGSVRTVAEIFKVFKAKTKHPGDLELLGELGITYWPSYQPWKIMDLHADKFWLTVPPLKILTTEEVQQRFGMTVPGLDYVEEMVPRTALIERDGLFFIENDRFILNEVEVLEEGRDYLKVRMRERVAVDGRNFLSVMRATCEKEMSFLRTHAFADVYIPLGDGRYQVFNDGKYPQKYPSNLFRLVTDFVRTVLAALQIYDDNVWFNHRNHTREAIGLYPKQGYVLMEIKRYLLKLARDDKLGFEFQAEGCAKMQQVDIFKMLMLLQHEKRADPEGIEHRITDMLYSEELENYDLTNIPNFFRTSLYQVQPEGFLGCFYALIKMTPLWMQPYVVSLVYMVFGAWRGLKIKLGQRDVEMTHLHSKCWHDETSYKHSLYHPGFLHKQQQYKGITLEKRKRDALRNDKALTPYFSSVIKTLA